MIGARDRARVAGWLVTIAVAAGCSGAKAPAVAGGQGAAGNAGGAGGLAALGATIATSIGRTGGGTAWWRARAVDTNASWATAEVASASP